MKIKIRILNLNSPLLDVAKRRSRLPGQRRMNSNKKDKYLIKVKVRCRSLKGCGKNSEIPRSLVERSRNPAGGATGIGSLAFRQTERRSRVS